MARLTLFGSGVLPDPPPQAARELTPEVPVFFREGTELAPEVSQETPQLNE